MQRDTTEWFCLQFEDMDGLSKKKESFFYFYLLILTLMYSHINRCCSISVQNFLGGLWLNPGLGWTIANFVLKSTPPPWSLFYRRSRWYFGSNIFGRSTHRLIRISFAQPSLIPNLNSSRKLLPRPCDPRISEHHTTVNIMKIPAILLDMDMAMPVFLMQMLPQPRLRLEMLRHQLPPLLLKLMLVSLPAPLVTVSLDMAL